MANLSQSMRSNLATQYRSNIPAEMRERKQWLCYRNYSKQDADGNWKHSKIPYSPTLQTSKGWNQEAAWVSFDEALNEFQNNEYMSGLSFMVTDSDPYVAIDLDHCIVNGELTETAQEFVSQMEGTYIERSRSKTGIHIFCKATMVGNFNNNGVEMYSEKKPIAMTGDSRCKLFQHSIEVKDKVVGELYNKYAPKRTENTYEPRQQSSVSIGDIPSNSEVLEIMSKYDKNGYELYCFGGNTGNKSQDDWQLMLHLNRFFHGDINRMVDVFMNSACSRKEENVKRQSAEAYEKYVYKTAENVTKIARANYWDYSYGKKKTGQHFDESVSNKEIENYYANKKYKEAVSKVPSKERVLYLMKVYDKKAWDLLMKSPEVAQRKDDWIVINSLSKFCSGDEQMINDIFKKSKFSQKFENQNKQQSYDYYISRTIEKVVNSPNAYFWKHSKAVKSLPQAKQDDKEIETEREKD